MVCCKHVTSGVLVLFIYVSVQTDYIYTTLDEFAFNFISENTRSMPRLRWADSSSDAPRCGTVLAGSNWV